METIRLTSSELMGAALVGVMRQVTNLRDAREDAYGCRRDDGWRAHIEGACGECAVAKFLGMYWNGSLGKLRAADVGTLQVRTRSRHDYDLIVHPGDEDDSPFVLVTGTAPVYVLRGWIRGRDAKLPEFWSDPAGGRPAFFMPQSRLRAMRDLKGT